MPGCRNLALQGGHYNIYMQIKDSIKYFDMPSEKFHLNNGDIKTIIAKQKNCTDFFLNKGTILRNLAFSRESTKVSGALW